MSCQIKAHTAGQVNINSMPIDFLHYRISLKILLIFESLAIIFSAHLGQLLIKFMPKVNGTMAKV